MKKIGKKKEEKKISFKDISIDDLEKEISREKYVHSYSRILKSTIYILIIIIAVSSIFATILMPVVEVTNSSMKPLLNDGEIILTIKNASLKQGDLVAFYHGNKILIKRVIGVAGDVVNIDIQGNVYVNGNLLKEDYVKELKKGDVSVNFPMQVSDGSVFVLSDERDNLIDSRMDEIGCVKKDDVIGKVFFRIWPIKQLGSI